MAKAEVDLHIEVWLDEIFSRIGWPLDATPDYSPQDLLKAFDGLVVAAKTFGRRGRRIALGAQ